PEKRGPAGRPWLSQPHQTLRKTQRLIIVPAGPNPAGCTKWGCRENNPRSLVSRGGTSGRRALDQLDQRLPRDWTWAGSPAGQVRLAASALASDRLEEGVSCPRWLFPRGSTGLLPDASRHRALVGSRLPGLAGLPCRLPPGSACEPGPSVPPQ